MPVPPGGRPALGRGVRLAYDGVRGRPALLYPEGVLLLNESAAAVLTRCDGTRTVDAIAGDLAAEYDGVAAGDVAAVVAEVAGRHLVDFDPPAPVPVAPPAGAGAPAGGPPPDPPPDPAPIGMVAELTYRCPLHCPYCSNPVDMRPYRDELGTGDWLRVLGEARSLGVLQVHFSGGEPALRRDLADLVGEAHRLGAYTNLVTSGIPMDAGRLAELAAAGLDHVQLSFQDAVAGPADAVAGMPAHTRKTEVAAAVTAAGLPLTVNAVLHRGNVTRLLDITRLAAELGADRLELAHTQYYGWGLRNRAVLMPTEEQIATAERDAAEARERYGDRMQIVYVVPDHHLARPKACMAGWGSRMFVIAPNGDVLPCLAAAQLPGLEPPGVRTGSLADAWYRSEAFDRFRGTGWMREPCRSCPLKEEDLGGCRCQAFQLTGDAAATDPVCELSPHHGLVAAALTEARTGDGARRPVPRRPGGGG
ncbi:pyrroloquinoline quinone biosynthesis protein PqqE [Streptomyces sp. TRM 70361]|uniref:pyrroloquinoline quinone biosynthesis protein PqqE n=1 Tax=Streptomyces sp. TRM 70361 TaxID=3116553 RepID=UPI002E7C3534|nr:pyrroloquinoline quinone biosynthesis protein PqqE [Streptomyces sp. TRM 70361]MEE1942820.1 pyrroloquinoline quinone biosynthesis protein PqqE [Streptomyces sp. TRM 70361]